MKKLVLNIFLILLVNPLIWSQEMELAGYPVMLDNDTVLTITTGIGAFNARARSEAITKNLLQLAKSTSFNEDSLKINHLKDYFYISHRSQTLVSISFDDTIYTGKSQAETAEIYKANIADAIKKYQEFNRLENIITRILIILGVLVGYYFIFKLFNILFRRINHRIVNNQKWVKDFNIRNYVLLDKEKFGRTIGWALKIVKIVLLIFLFYLTLPIIFVQFPVTEHIAKMLIGWVLSPFASFFRSLVAFLPNFITIIVIIFITKYINAGVNFLALEIETGKLVLPGFHPDYAKTTANLIKVLIIIFAIVAIFPYLPGSDSKIFQGISVFIGVLFSLGSSSAISNIVAGIVITYMRPFKVSDRIKFGDMLGIVIEKNLLVTRIRTTKNEDITIPNSSILSGNVINYSKAAKNEGIIIYTTVTIGYDAPWRTVHQLLIDAAWESEGIEKEPKPYVLQTSLDDFYVSYQINAYTKLPAKMPLIYSNLHQNIQDKFNEGGVEIMSPHYKTLRDGNTTTIPSDYLSENYVAPAFKVEKK